MNQIKLTTAIEHLKCRQLENPESLQEAMEERKERIAFYQGFSSDKLLTMTEDDFYKYISRLWAMIIWGNKKFVVDKIIADNGFDNVKKQLAELLFGSNDIIKRWDNFLKKIKGMGPATISELLSYYNPDEYMIFNGTTVKALNFLEVPDLPKYNYQYTGKRFLEVCKIGKQIAAEMKNKGIQDTTLLAVDYLLWDEMPSDSETVPIVAPPQPTNVVNNHQIQKSLHDEIKQKLVEIGIWLGFESRAEVKIAAGAVVDAVWEVKIGNMGKAIYVFEVQSSGSIDSLILNLLRAQSNAAVQAIVAVSSAEQIEKINKELPENAIDRKKLKMWDFDEVAMVHESLSKAHASINKLALVPDGFNS